MFSHITLPTFARVWNSSLWLVVGLICQRTETLGPAKWGLVVGDRQVSVGFIKSLLSYMSQLWPSNSVMSVLLHSSSLALRVSSLSRSSPRPWLLQPDPTFIKNRTWASGKRQICKGLHCACFLLSLLLLCNYYTALALFSVCHYYYCHHHHSFIFPKSWGDLKKLWKRTHSLLQQFHPHLNRVRLTITFTMQVEDRNTWLFPDISVVTSGPRLAWKCSRNGLVQDAVCTSVPTTNIT